MARLGPERVLVVNAGSSSLKLRVLDPSNAVVASAEVEAVGSSADAAVVREAIGGLRAVDAVGHRVVHGGTRFTAPVAISPGVVAELEALTALAPLHQPRSLAGIAAVSEALPGVPAVACFDTAFHATIPDAAATYAIPREWRERWAIRRYGFHGLSHAYASRRVAELLGRAGDPGLRVVTCHLGAGASLAAVLGGRSVDTTMGFTPLEGLVMATRSGTVDPGLILWLATEQGIAPAELTESLERRSGLLGLGGSADMRSILAAVDAGDRDAPLALDVYIHRLRASIAAMAASLDGLDAIAFTGGVGERSARIRGLAAAGLALLGIALDFGRERGRRGRVRRGDRRTRGQGAGVRDPGARGRRDRARRPGDRLRDLIANVWPHFELRPSRVATYARNRVIP